MPSSKLIKFYINKSADKIIRKEITIDDVIAKYRDAVIKRLKERGYNENGDPL